MSSDPHAAAAGDPVRPAPHVARSLRARVRGILAMQPFCPVTTPIGGERH